MSSRQTSDEALLRQRLPPIWRITESMHNMTQSELAECISYSGKSVSKWERAEGVPDIFVPEAAGRLVQRDRQRPDQRERAAAPAHCQRQKGPVVILLLSVGWCG
jgi:DNA-binding XRE family transcriptional regulator